MERDDFDGERNCPISLTAKPDAEVLLVTFPDFMNKE
jgi:hypothetical protein